MFYFIFLGWRATKKKAPGHQLQGPLEISKFIQATLPLYWLTFQL